MEEKLIPFGFTDDEEYKMFLVDLQKVLSYPCGKNVINRLIGSCNIFETTNNFNNHMQAFKEGTRNIGLQMVHSIMDIDNGKLFTDMLSFYWKQCYDRRIL